jgi:hypothetical protein
MRPPLRIVAVVIFAVALVASPVVLEQCVAACSADHTAADATAACHHAGAPAAQIAGIPNGCGHDHSGAVAVDTLRSSRLDPVSHRLVPNAPDVPDAAAALNVVSRLIATERATRFLPTLHARPLPLRV